MKRLTAILVASVFAVGAIRAALATDFHDFVSGLPAATVAGADTLYIVQGGVSKKATAQAVANLNTLDLAKASNLSDLASASAARGNLGSTGVGDALFITGSAGAARTTLGSTTVGDALFITGSAATARATLGSTTVGDALFITGSAAAARSTLGSGAGGDAVFIAASAAAARSALGSTTTGDALFITGSAAAARTTLGSTTVGDAVFIAASAAAARSALGSTTTGDALFITGSAAAARTTLGSTTVGDAVFIAANAAAARAALVLGTAATLDVGTTASKIVQLDGSAKLPAVDGSQLTNLPGVSGCALPGTTNGILRDSGSSTCLDDANFTYDGSIVTDAKALALSGDLTPTALSGAVNDYAPTNFATAFRIRQDGGAADRNVTGLAGGAAGRLVTVVNIGTTNNLVLKNQSGSSSAANRFLLGADATLTPGQSLALHYDSTSSRWRPFSFTGAGSGSGTVTSVATECGAVGGPITASGTISGIGPSVALGDVNSTIAGTTSFAPITATLTAARSYTLPSAGSYKDTSGNGCVLAIFDAKGDSIDGTKTVTLLRAGSDTIIGGATFPAIINPNFWIVLKSDGVSNWNILSGGLIGPLLTGQILNGVGNQTTAVSPSGDIASIIAGAFTIAANAVTNAKAAQMAAHTFKGNKTGSTANAADLTATELTAELNNVVGDSGSGGTKGMVPAATAGDAALGKVLGAGGAFVNPSQVNGNANVAFLDTNQSWTKGQAVTPAAMGAQSAGGTLTLDFSSSNHFTATFGAGNLTVANPTNVKAGECGFLALTQDGTGSRTVAWGANWKWAGGTAPTLSTVAASADLFSYCAVTTSAIVAQLAIKGYQ